METRKGDVKCEARRIGIAVRASRNVELKRDPKFHEFVADYVGSREVELYLSVFLSGILAHCLVTLDLRRASTVCASIPTYPLCVYK